VSLVLRVEFRTRITLLIACAFHDIRTFAISSIMRTNFFNFYAQLRWGNHARKN
jgi:hypothetical protein